MKNYFLNFSFLFFLSLCQDIYAQSHTPTINVVLEVSTVTSKNYNEVKSALKGTSGITLLAFCEESKCFLLTYDSSIIESTDNIEKVVQQLHPSYKTKIKTNVTVAGMIDKCTRMSSEASATTPSSE